MAKITNRKEALKLKNSVCKVKEEYLNGDKCFDEFAKLEELTFEDDFYQYLIDKYAELSRHYLDDKEEYIKEYGDENPSILCFNDIIEYLDGIISGKLSNEIKRQDIGEESFIEVNGVDFLTVRRIDIEEIDGESIVLLYGMSNLIAKIPFYDIVSYQIKESNSYST